MNDAWREQMSEQMNRLVDLVVSAKSIIDDEKNINARTEKGAFDFATQADIKVQKFIESGLAKMYPGDQFMGEESKGQSFDMSARMWILDPIDGTTNLIHHYPHCAISLALMENHEIILGIVYNPFRDELFTAEKGKGAFHNGKRIEVSKIKTIHDSLVTVGTAPYEKQFARRDFEIMCSIFEACQDIRRGGAAALDIAYVAAGVSDCYYERILQPWDYSAGKVILEEAGGKMTTIGGEEVPLGEKCPVMVSNGLVHEELMAFLRPMV